MTISEAYRRFQQVDLRNQVPVIIELTSEEIILLNQMQLYTESLDKSGAELGGYRSQEYENLKRGLNPGLDGKVDLRLTGDFYGGFYVRVEDTEFTIGSTDSKASKLEAKYGKAIFGMTDESKARYSMGVFFNALKNYIENITKIQMK